MTSDEASARGPVALSDVDLLSAAQNPKTPIEVLERILAHPALSPGVLAALLRHPLTPSGAMARLAEQACGPILDALLTSRERLGRWVEVLEALLRNPALSAESQPTVRAQIEAAKKRDPEGARKSLLLRIKDLPAGEKLALAKKGNRDVRMILIKDSNEMVALEAAASPRTSDEEMLAVAQMRDVSDKVLRYIASNRKYRQNHQVLVALLNNPRTPVGVSLGLGLHLLTDRELAHLAKSHDVAGAVSRAAKQILDRRKGAQAAAGGGN